MALTEVSDVELLARVKSALGITGNYQDDTLSIYIYEVKEYMKAGGVSSDVINSTLAVGAISRGVADIWNYSAGDADFSSYFMQRVIQLAYENGGGD